MSRIDDVNGVARERIKEILTLRRKNTKLEALVKERDAEIERLQGIIDAAGRAGGLTFTSGDESEERDD
jgi:hypothetical protein